MFSDHETAVDEIAATFAHEVKNPVSLIRANIDYIELVGDVSPYSKNFKIIKRELDKILNVVVDFIELSKPMKAEHLQKIDLLALVSDVIDDLKASVQNKDLAFELHATGNAQDLCIAANQTHICSLFFNVYKNAIEALETTPQARIKTVLSKHDQTLLIHVIDNGSGLADASDIGNPFVTTKEGGSGLGLAICKNIVHKYGGDFSLTNNTQGEHGCVVTIVLPLAAPDPDEE